MVARALGKVVAVAVAGGTAMATTMIWPVLYGPVTIFLAGGSLAIETMKAVKPDTQDSDI